MAKFRRINNRKWNQKIQIKRQKQLKYNYLYDQDNEIESRTDQIIIKQRIPSKQQYKRSRTESMRSEYESNQDKIKRVPFIVINNKSSIIRDDNKSSASSKSIDEYDCMETLAKRCRNHLSSGGSIINTPPASAGLKPNSLWFEDSDHFQFVDEHDIDFQQVLVALGECKEPEIEPSKLIQENNDDDEIHSLTKETEELVQDLNNQSKWMMELSETRITDAKESLVKIKEELSYLIQILWTLKQEPESIEHWKQIQHDFKKNHTITEAMLYFMRDLNHIEDWETLHEETMKWTEINSEYVQLEELMRELDSFQIHASYFEKNLKQTISQLITVLHKDEYLQLELQFVMESFKLSFERIKQEMNLLQSVTLKNMSNTQDLNMKFMDQLEVSFNKILMNYDLKSMIDFLELNDTQFQMDLDLSIIKEKLTNKSTNTNDQNPMKIPLRMMMFLIMSLVYMFGNTDFDNNFDIASLLRSNSSNSLGSNNISTILETLISQGLLSQIGR